MQTRAIVWTRRLAVVILSASTAISAAQESIWSVVTKTDDGLMTFYGDRTSVVVQGSLRRAKLLYDYKLLQQDPDTFVEHRSTIEIVSVDCRNHRIAAVQSTDYAGNMGKGTISVQSIELPPEQLRYIVAKPASIDERVISYVCALHPNGKRLLPPTARYSQPSPVPR